MSTVDTHVITHFGYKATYSTKTVSFSICRDLACVLGFRHLCPQLLFRSEIIAIQLFCVTPHKSSLSFTYALVHLHRPEASPAP